MIGKCSEGGPSVVGEHAGEAQDVVGDLDRVLASVHVAADGVRIISLRKPKSRRKRNALGLAVVADGHGVDLERTAERRVGLQSTTESVLTLRFGQSQAGAERTVPLRSLNALERMARSDSVTSSAGPMQTSGSGQNERQTPQYRRKQLSDAYR